MRALAALVLALGWLRAGPPVFNVRDFGARGNGHADDTPAIARALAAADRAGGGTVYFPRGTYAIIPSEGPLYLSSGVTVAGTGRDSIVRVRDHAGRYDLIFGQHPGRLRNVALRRLRVDQNPRGNPTDVNRLPATRLANVCPAHVNTGRPAQSASLAVVCAL